MLSEMLDSLGEIKLHRCKFVHRYTTPEEGIPELTGVDAVDNDGAIVLAVVLGSHRGCYPSHCGGVRCSNPVGGAVDHFGKWAVGDDTATVHEDEMVGCSTQLIEGVRGDEHRAAASDESSQFAAEPLEPIDV